MKLFHRKAAEATTVPEDLQPYYSNSGSGVRSWLGPILRGLLLLAVLALLIWAGIWLVHKLANRKSTDKTVAGQNTSQSTKTKTPTPAPAPAPAVATPTPTPAQASPTPVVTPTPSQTQSPAPAGGQGGGATGTPLTNSGPGNTALLFGVVSVGGTILHYAYSARRSRAAS